MRKLKHHEQKLLKKVDFYQWKSDSNIREVKILRRYRIQDREDYTKYNKMCGLITKVTARLRKTKSSDEERIRMTEILLDKLYQMGVIPSKQSLEEIYKLSASSFCRRRLAVVVVRMKFCENLKQAVTFIEQGHFRVGPEVVTNPALHVTREMEDHITWSEGSRIKRKVEEFRDQVDDYTLLGN